MKQQKFNPLKSSILQGYSYDADSQTLTVTFRNGNKFAYHDVPPPAMSNVFDRGGSVGSRFVKQIANSYKFERLAPSSDKWSRPPARCVSTPWPVGIRATYLDANVVGI